jgi:pantoate--beta-alanine ligase
VYFGEKDAQQLVVIRRMVHDLNMPVEIIGMPIVREPDGLAMSSRNVYLSPEERTAAHVLCLAVSLAARMFDDAERDASRIRKAMQDLIAAQPLASIDYVSVADAETLEEIDVVERTALVSLAVRFGKTRLIDNTVLRTG